MTNPHVNPPEEAEQEAVAQKRWLEKFNQRGWITAVCNGASDAIDLLEALGYGKDGANAMHFGQKQT